jgi:hypothetical protein
MRRKLADLEMVTDVEAVVGTYTGKGKFTFGCEDGKYGKEGSNYYLAVKYDDVEKSAEPATMMASKWNSGPIEFVLAWTGLENDTKGVVHTPKGSDGWAFLKITQGG